MRILRVKLRNYRGIAEQEVQFVRDGVNVIVGPNEAGKTSIAEAIDLLFDHLDSSKRKAVRDVKPVHLDEGAEIEADVECGDYAFTYFKRFHRRPQTKLTVTAPRPESHTGREAHARALEILAETVDVDLWRALRVQQGEELQQPELAGRTSLAAALDRVAGGLTRAGPEEETLYESVREEFEKYFTPTGRPRRERAEAAAAVEEAEAEAARLAKELEDIESQVERCALLDSRVLSLRASLVDLQATVDKWEKQRRAVEQRSESYEMLQARLTAAEAQLAETQREADLRKERREVTEKASKQMEEARQRAGSVPDQLALIERELSEAAHALEHTRGEQAKAERILTIHQGDLEYRRWKLDLDQLSERRDRIVTANREADAAAELLAGTRIDDEKLEAIQQAHLEAERARARTDTSSPVLRIEAIEGVALQVEGNTVPLEAGATWEKHVAEELEVELWDVARVQVRPSGGAHELLQKQREQEQALEKLLADAGVESLGAALAANNARQDAERKVESRDRIVQENLRDLERDALDHKITSLERKVRLYPTTRVDDPPIALDFDSAQDLVETSRVRCDAAEKGLAEASRKHDEVVTRNTARRERLLEVQGKLDLAQTLATEAMLALTRSRAQLSDEDLSQRLAERRAAAEDAREACAVAKADLDEHEPSVTLMRAENAAKALENAHEELRAKEDERLALTSRLEALGEQGLAERHGEACTAVERARDAHRSLEGRAEAAGLLFDTLTAKRDEVRSAYVAPLASHIEDLGRYVFGEGFTVTLDDDLSVESRTLANRTVPYDGLSGGAKEQLSLLARIACCMTVAGDGGVPLVLDDAMGYTDAERLEGVGAVLSLAGKRCQVIVLTCAPERFRYVGNANVIELD